MTFLRSLTIGRRLAFGFGLVIALALAVAVYGSVQFGLLSAQTRDLAEDRMVKLEQASTLRDNVGVTVRNLRDVILTMDEEVRQRLFKEIETARADNVRLSGLLNATAVAESDRVGMKALTDAGKVYDANIDKVIAFAKESSNEAARDTLFKEVGPAQAADGNHGHGISLVRMGPATVTSPAPSPGDRKATRGGAMQRLMSRRGRRLRPAP